VIVSVAPELAAAMVELAAREGVPATPVGRVGGGRIRVAIDGERVLDDSLEDAEQAWATSLGARFERPRAIA
jgi:hypothetical protein